MAAEQTTLEEILVKTNKTQSSTQEDTQEIGPLYALLKENEATARAHVANLESNKSDFQVLVVDLFGVTSETQVSKSYTPGFYASNKLNRPDSFSNTTFEAICRALTWNKSVTSASFLHMLQGWDKSCDALIAVVKYNTTLKNLLLLGVHISPKEAKLLSEALENNKTLNELELSACRLDNEAMALLLAAFIKNTAVVKLGMCSNNKVRINGQLAQVIQNVLTHNKTLTALDLSKNAMTIEGIICIIKGLKTNKTLENLNLQGCGISDYQAILIAETLPYICLRSLDLSKNVFSETSLRVLAGCLSENSSLTELVLDYPKNSEGSLEPSIQAIQQKIQAKLAANAKLLEKPRIDLEAEQKQADERFACYAETLKQAELLKSPSSTESIVQSSAELPNQPEKSDLSTLSAFEKVKTDKASEASKQTQPSDSSSKSSDQPSDSTSRTSPRYRRPSGQVAQDWIYDLT